MRKSRFSETEIVGILKELKAGAKAAALCRKYGMSKLRSTTGTRSTPASK